MPTLFLEPHSGLSGDMLLAALLDLGDPRFRLEDLEALAESLVPGECLTVVRVDVLLEAVVLAHARDIPGAAPVDAPTPVGARRLREVPR